MILRQFVGGRGHYWAALDGALTPDQESALGSGENPFIERPVVRDQPSRLSEHDEKQLVDLAAAAELTPGRVSRRLTTLLSNRSAPGGR
ncbi:hypothetical protein SAMN04489731_107140 [Amycolatopsis regifaucium]|nr:hypothetical protein SAMN04489731_107140 [Amycolatopsis regifaucium]